MPTRRDAAWAERAAAAALEARGFEVSLADRAGGARIASLIASRAGQRLLVEIRTLCVFRREDLLGALARLILELRRVVAGDDLRGVLVVGLPRVTERAERITGEYLLEHGAGRLDWMLLGRDGDGVACLGGVRERWEAPPRESPSVSAPRTPPGSLFAPGFQWLLKILLMRKAPPAIWGGVRSAAINLTELARDSGLSQSYVSKFVAAAQAAGHLSYASPFFFFRSVDRLLDDWAAYLRTSPDSVVRARPLYPVAGEDAPLQDIQRRLVAWSGRSGPPAAALTGHAACAHFGVSASTVAVVRVCVRDDVASALRRLDLVRADSEPAPVVLVVPRAARAAFGGAVRRNGVPVVDALQCYLDLRAGGARGAEQADLLMRRVLEPHLQGLS